MTAPPCSQWSPMSPSTASRRPPSRQRCGLDVATPTDEARNRRYVRRPPVTELPGETTLLEPNSHLQSEGEDGDACRNRDRAKEDGPACPHQDVPDVEGVSRVPVGAVRDEVLGCEQMIGVELEHPPVALLPVRRVARGGPHDHACACGEQGDTQEIADARPAVPASAPRVRRKRQRRRDVDGGVDESDERACDERRCAMALHVPAQIARRGGECELRVVVVERRRAVLTGVLRPPAMTASPGPGPTYSTPTPSSVLSIDDAEHDPGPAD